MAEPEEARAEAQRDEIEALTSIYGSERVLVERPPGSSPAPGAASTQAGAAVEVIVDAEAPAGGMVVPVHVFCDLPSAYPAFREPVPPAAAPRVRVGGAVDAAVQKVVQRVVDESAGEPMLFTLLEELRSPYVVAELGLLPPAERKKRKSDARPGDSATGGAAGGAGGADRAAEGSWPLALQHVMTTFGDRCEQMQGAGLRVTLSEDAVAFVDAEPPHIVSVSNPATFAPALTDRQLAEAAAEAKETADDPHDIPVLTLQGAFRVLNEASGAADGFSLDDGADADAVGAAKWADSFFSELRATATDRELLIYTYGRRMMKSQPRGSQRAFNACILNARGGGVDLRRARGTDEVLQAIVCSSRRFEQFITTIVRIIERDDLHTVSVFCSAGHHRSVAVAELLVKHVYRHGRCRHLTINR